MEPPDFLRLAVCLAAAALLLAAAAVAWAWRPRAPARAQAAPAVRLLEEPAPAVRGKFLVERADWARLPPWVWQDRGPGRAAPALEDDPLFRDNDDPELLPFLPPLPAAAFGRGAAVILPGGNYETLTPGEAEPVAQWLTSALRIPACVAKYRLLPHFGLPEMAEDLAAAVLEARRLCGGGPVVTLGFSAGAHLSAVGCVAAAADGAGGPAPGRPDAQVLVYPSLDASEWLEATTACFFRTDVASPQVRSLVQGPGSPERMLAAGPAFVRPPPTFMVASTFDGVCHAENHGDAYCRAARQAGAELRYMRGPFGFHGFGLQDFWAEPCARWLQDLGFGPGAGGGKQKAA